MPSLVIGPDPVHFIVGFVAEEADNRKCLLCEQPLFLTEVQAVEVGPAACITYLGYTLARREWKTKRRITDFPVLFFRLESVP